MFDLWKKGEALISKLPLDERKLLRLVNLWRKEIIEEKNWPDSFNRKRKFLIIEDY